MADLFELKIKVKTANRAVGTTAGASVTLVNSDPKTLLSPLGIQCSGDAAATIEIQSPAGTLLWRKRFAGAYAFSETFSVGAIRGAGGQNLICVISASTANCEVAMQAALLPA